MNIKTLKIATATLFGAVLLGGSQSAFANWDPGPCTAADKAGPAPCIEYEDSSTTPVTWWHFNGDPLHTNQWHGPNDAGGSTGSATNTFEFTGTSTLSCGSLEATCDLTLNGQVKKFQDASGNWKVGVKVLSGNVGSGGALCGAISVGGFPWYAGPDNPNTDPYHGPYDNSTGVDYPGPTAPNLIGSMGTIDVSVFLVPQCTVSDTHIHDVIFSNNGSGVSYFQFANELFTFPHSGTGVSVNGQLLVNDYVDDINIY